MKWPWSKRGREALASPGNDRTVDPRWEFFSESWVCSTCEILHEGLFDLSVFAPAYWSGEEVYEPNSAISVNEDFLSEDFCVLSEGHYFIRCVLELPLIGRMGRFGYGVWASSSRENFERYVEHFNADSFDHDEVWFGWFANDLKGYPECLELKCDVFPQRGRQRPVISLHDDHHPLVLEQRNGISFDRLMEIYQLNGHARASPAS